MSECMKNVWIVLLKDVFAYNQCEIKHWWDFAECIKGCCNLYINLVSYSNLITYFITIICTVFESYSFQWI